MIKQHIYRCGANGYHTAAVSSCMKDNAWLPLLEQQMSIHYSQDISAPAYYQYPLGRGLIVSRCARDLLGQNGSYLAHQLVFDEEADITSLMNSRPLPSTLFNHTYPDVPAPPDPLPTLSGGALRDEEELVSCLQTMDALFAGDEWLLSRFLAALAMTARDKRQSIQAVIDASASQVSETGRRIMELMLRALPAEDALRISYCTLQPPGSVSLLYSVCFSQPEKNMAFFRTQLNIVFDFTARRMTLPKNVTLPEDALYIELARALLAHDLNWVDRLRGGSVPIHVQQSVDSLRMEIPPFEKGMSLRSYFGDWRNELTLRRDSLTEEGFRAFAGHEWPRLLNEIVSASELMENRQFLKEMTAILNAITREHLEDELSLSQETHADLIIILLDSIKWQEIDLFDPRSQKAVRVMTAYAMALEPDPAEPGCLTACRIMNRLLTLPGSIPEQLQDLSSLHESSQSAFEALQDCIRRYAKSRLTSDIDVIDELLVASAMMGYVRFADGVPDLRLVDKLLERIESQYGAATARKFRNHLDRLRRRLHTSRAGSQRRRDMKIFLAISCILAALIAGITIWFLYLS